MTSAPSLPLPSQDLLRERLEYEPETGLLRWAYSRPGVRLGSIAGHLNKHTNSWQLTIDKKLYLAHRIIWKWMTGDDPPELIDHANGDPADNRWENLRLATHGENSRNQKGWGKYLKGARPSTCGTTWQASIFVEGERIFLGCFTSEKAAHNAYCKAAEVLHGEFANLGIVPHGCR